MSNEIGKGRRRPGRPRKSLNVALARRLRNEGRTLSEIAAELGCGRGTVARALAVAPASPGPPVVPCKPIVERARELAEGRTAPPQGTEERQQRRENARHLVHRRWGDGMKVEGREFRPAEPPRAGSRGLGIVLVAGGMLLWALGCPVPL